MYWNRWIGYGSKNPPFHHWFSHQIWVVGFERPTERDLDCFVVAFWVAHWGQREDIRWDLMCWNLSWLPKDLCMEELWVQLKRKGTPRLQWWTKDSKPWSNRAWTGLEGEIFIVLYLWKSSLWKWRCGLPWGLWDLWSFLHKNGNPGMGKLRIISWKP
jgi:hypothetical protein